MVLLHYIIVYYVTKLHYSRLLYLTLSWLLFSILFIILFLFLFYFSISLLSNFKFCLIWCCICRFISYLSYCIYYQFISLCIPRYPLNQKCGEKPTGSFFFSSRHIWKHIFLLRFTFYVLLVLLIFNFFSRLLF